MVRSFRLGWQSRSMRRKGFVQATGHFGAPVSTGIQKRQHKAVLSVRIGNGRVPSTATIQYCRFVWVPLSSDEKPRRSLWLQRHEAVGLIEVG